MFQISVARRFVEKALLVCRRWEQMLVLSETHVKSEKSQVQAELSENEKKEV